MAWLAIGAQADPQGTDPFWLLILGLSSTLLALYAYRVGEQRSFG